MSESTLFQFQRRALDASHRLASQNADGILFVIGANLVCGVHQSHASGQPCEMFSLILQSRRS